MIASFIFPENELPLYTSFRYPAGEVQTRLTPEGIEYLKQASTVHVLVRKLVDEDVVRLAQLLSCIHLITNAEVFLIIPYLPYARADRRFVTGDCHGLAAFAHILKSMQYNKIVTLDAHSIASGRWLMPLIEVSPKPIIQSVREGIGDPTILLPDDGAARYGIKGLQCEKQRDSATGKLSGFKVPHRSAFTNKSVLIVDDICDGGGTFLGIADAMAGYNLDLYLYVTHGIFSKGFDDLFLRFKHIFTTDSFPSQYLPTSGPLTVIPAYGTILASLLNPEELWRNANESSYSARGVLRTEGK